MSSAPSEIIIDSEILIVLFNKCFSQTMNTQLLGGGEEPEYIPADESCDYHRIIFTRDYVASALHEIAHWCVAGANRRLQRDYGYWYEPDGRNELQQAAFEQVEIKPQALEWIFSVACGQCFRVSADNLASNAAPSDTFKQAITQQVHDYCKHGVNDRAKRWIEVLSAYSNRDDIYTATRYSADVLK